MPNGARNTTAVLDKNDRLVTWLIFLATLVLYLLTTSRIHTYDGLQYAISVESDRYYQLFHPHHLLYNFLSFILWKPLTLIFPNFRAIHSMGFVSALSAAGALAILWRFWRHTRVSRILSLVGVIWLGLSYGYWSYAAEVEVYLPACFFLALALDRAALANDGAIKPYVRQLGWALALMVLSTQSAIILWPGFLWWMGREKVERRSRLISLLLHSFIPVLLFYLLSTWAIVGLEPIDIYLWLTSYAQSGQWGHWLPGWFLTTISGIFTTMLCITPLVTLPMVIEGVVGPFWIVWVYVGGLFLVVSGTFWGWSRQLCGWRGAVLPLWIMIFAHFFFFAWWQPENTEFWIILMLLLMTIAVWGISRLSRFWRFAMAGVLLVLGLGGGLVNYLLFIGPRTNEENDKDLKALRMISQLVTKDDYLLLPQDSFEKKLRYFGRYPHALNMGELTYGQDNPDWMEVLKRLKSWQNEVETTGGKVYILGEVLTNSNIVAAARSGDKAAQIIYEMLTSQAYPVMELSTAEESYELSVLERNRAATVVLDVLQLNWPPGTVEPLGEGDAFFNNFTAEQPLTLPQDGNYLIKVRGRGNAYEGQGAILRLYLDDKPLGQLEFSEPDWVMKPLPIQKLDHGWHRLKFVYNNDIYDEANSQGRDLFLSRIYFIPMEQAH